MGMKVIAYRPDMAAAWDAFVQHSRNGTFLHARTFMDYHSDRFGDRSSIVMLDDEIVGLFPANDAGAVVASHNGLTFGGLVFGIDQRASLVRDMLAVLMNYYSGLGYEKILYKAVPHVFHRYPAEDDLFALQNVGAKLVRRDLSAVIPAAGPAKISTLRKRGKSKALKSNVVIREGEFYEDFYALLSQALERHSTVPVHSLADFLKIKQRVNSRVKLIGAFENEILIAGTWLFLFDTALHTQYLANSSRGQEIGALDLLLFHVIEQSVQQRLHLSFGASTEKGGTILNEGLMAQKEGFGARGLVLDQYEIAL